MTTFVHQITSGLAGWLTFEQMRSGVDNLSEAALYHPIECIAQGRKFEVKSQFPLLIDPPRPGAPSTIDFVMVNRITKLVIALELKYKKPRKKMAGSLGEDAYKLSKLTLDELNYQIEAGKCGNIKQRVDGYTLVRAVIIVWHKTDISQQLQCESKFIRRQFIKLLRLILPTDIKQDAENLHRAMLGGLAIRPVAKPFGSLRAGSTASNKRFWVASLIYQPEWK